MDIGAWIKQFMPRSLLARSLLILVTPLIVLQLVSAYVFFETHWDNLARRLANGLAGDVGAVIELMRRFPGDEAREDIFRIALTEMALDLRFEPGGILPNEAPAPAAGFWYSSLVRGLNERVARPYHIDVETYEKEVAIDVQLNDGVLHVLVSRKRLYSMTTYVFVLWMVGTSLLLFGIATIFMKNQVRSVRRLASTADAFGKGQDVPGFKPEGATEVRQAAIAFVRMRDRIKRQVAQRTEMLAGVSHDLRTPLTRMKLQLAMMPQDESIAELQEDVAEMEQMVDGYLAFARGEGREKFAQANLSELASEVVGRHRRNSNTPLDLHLESDIALTLRPQAFSRALGNLIGNAVRYADHVSVRVGRRADGVEIVIDDDGPGIPPDKREEVFKPFSRLETSRNPRTGGVGLGLTIARDVVRSHGGDLTLEDSPLGGLRARLRLPV